MFNELRKLIFLECWYTAVCRKGCALRRPAISRKRFIKEVVNA